MRLLRRMVAPFISLFRKAVLDIMFNGLIPCLASVHGFGSSLSF